MKPKWAPTRHQWRSPVSTFGKEVFHIRKIRLSQNSANPPRSEKSGAKVRFLVDPTIGWRRHEWRFRVDERTRSRGRERASGSAHFRRGDAR